MDGTQDVLGFGTHADNTWMLARFNAESLMDSTRCLSKAPPGVAWLSVGCMLLVLDKSARRLGKPTASTSI